MKISDGNIQNEKNKVFFTRCTCPETTKEGLMGRCFITGDQCPHKKSIISKKIKRHKDGKIKAFVIMSFTSITDALYQWMLKDLITSNLNGDMEGQDVFYLGSTKITPDKIDIVRCDDSVYSSHIICESICSAIQEADLVVVDLSHPNPNVFYEFGLAVAMGKKILPICYLKTYYKVGKGEEHSIRTFDWKRTLFEWFSLNSQDGKRYGGDDYFKNFPFAGSPENECVGQNLREAFDHSLWKTNNLLLYEPRQSVQWSHGSVAGAINQFSEIVEKVTKGIRPEGDPVLESARSGSLRTDGMLSRGDRIMLLFSDKKIVIPDKDKKDVSVSYDYGDVCSIAINQANYNIESNEQSAQSRGFERKMWNYIYNCTESQNFDYPLFVDTIKERRFSELNFLLDGIPLSSQEKSWSFTYLDVILAKAQHCHTALIDMRENSIKALFWMGIFHGRGRFVVPIRYEGGTENARPENSSCIIEVKSENSSRIFEIKSENSSRFFENAKSENSSRIIADIAGLWNAYFQSNAPEGFSETVKKVLKGINQKSEHLDAWQKTQFLRSIDAWTYYPPLPSEQDKAEDKANAKANCDMGALDQYYRELFWNVLLAHGDVSLYPASYKASHRATVSHWDYNAIAQIEKFSNQRIGAFRTVLQDTLGIHSEEKERIRFPRIIIGDRTVNDVADELIHEIKDQVFQLRKCDLAYELQNNPKEDIIWRQCRRMRCDMYSPQKRRCIAPQIKPLRGFAKGKSAEWMAEFASNRALENIDELEQMDLSKLYGQIVFRRHRENLFSILLEGASGPATFALADLLSTNEFATKAADDCSDKDEKAVDGCSSEGKKKEHKKILSKESLLFYTLQEAMLVQCKEKLEEIYNNVLAKSEEVIYGFFAPAANYLMMGLCERFLPTTSERFIRDLNTRMHLFLTQLRKDILVSGKSEMYIEKSFNPIFEIFGTWFKWFENVHGMAVIIEIGIGQNPTKPDWDNRWPSNIKIAMEMDECSEVGKECFSIIE